MRRAVLVLLVMSVALLTRPVLAATTETSEDPGEERDHADEREHEHEPEQDDDSDSAPFMIVVQHTNKQRCGGSLVSLRTALTSAWCVRGQHGADPRELWALAPAVPPARPVARRVARVALAAGADSDAPPPHLEPAWGSAALDIAVLELEAPFGGDARSRPILMATRPEDCDMSSMCHVVRAIGTAPRLRIVDAALVPGERCGAVARGWPGLRDSALCLAGPELCESDRGAGVVCDGKLCGVLSRSSRDINTTTSDAPDTTAMELAGPRSSDEKCGDIHVAQSVARWRRFLHCAHTLRACGSGGECSELCSERQLMVMKQNEGDGGESGSVSERPSGGSGGGGDAEGAAGNEQNGDERTSNARQIEPDTDIPDTTVSSISIPKATNDAHATAISTSSLDLPDVSSVKRTGGPRSRTTTRLTPTHTTTLAPVVEPLAAGGAASARPSFEFEPNRADFKAGEYGDNAADYGGDEGALGPSLTTSTTSSSTKQDSAAAGRISEVAAQQSASVTTPSFRAGNCVARTPLHLPFIFVAVIINAL